MRDWADAKKFIFEGVILYSVLMLLIIFWDPIYNLSIAAGVNQGQKHPLSYGLFQDVGFVFCLFQVLRYLNFWRYWK